MRSDRCAHDTAPLWTILAVQTGEKVVNEQLLPALKQLGIDVEVRLSAEIVRFVSDDPSILDWRRLS